MKDFPNFKFTNYFLLTISYLLITISYFLFPFPASAQTASKSGEVTVGGRIGDFTINVSGFSSPNASVVLKNLDGNYIDSTAADSQGYFTFSGILVKKGLNGLCFQSIDFRRIGETEACTEFEPLITARDIQDIFIPPTIGLFKKVLRAGDQALIFGYSMPEAKVDVKIRNGQVLGVTADNSGYYEYRYEKIPAGTYHLSSTANYSGKTSLPPKYEAKLEVKSLAQQTEEAIGKVGKFLTSAIGLLLLLIILLVFAAIIALLIKKGKLAFALKIKRKKPLDFDWFLEFLEDTNKKKN